MNGFSACRGFSFSHGAHRFFGEYLGEFMKTRYMLSCAVAALVSSGAAVAQTQIASNGIEQVVVTAERRSQSVQNVPTTVQAFTGQALSDINAATLESLLRYTPNVTYGNNGPGQGEIFMRGLTNGFRGNQSSATIGNFPNVAIYLDDQSMQFPARNVDIYMVDMDRVEVLEGPQGTLFGGGAEAGAVRYITNKPKLERLRRQCRGQLRLHRPAAADNSAANLTLNVPIIDGQAGRPRGHLRRSSGRLYRQCAQHLHALEPGSGQSSTSASRPMAPASAPTACRPAAAGGCTLPLARAPQANNFSIAQKDFNPVDLYRAAAFSAPYQINDDWNVLIAESLENLDAEGLSVEYPVGSDFQPLKPLQVTSFSPSYDKDRYSNTAWTVNGKVGDLKAIYTGGYTDRDIHQQMDYTNYSRTARRHVLRVRRRLDRLRAPGRPTCYSPVAYWQDTIHSTHLSNELRVSTPDDWRLRAIGGAYWEQFRIYDVMNFNYKTIPACDAAPISRRAGRRAGLRRRCAHRARLDRQRSGHPQRRHRLRRGHPARLRPDRALRLGGLRHHPGCPDRHRRHALVSVPRVRGGLAVRHRHRLPECAERRIARGGMVNIDAAHDRKTYSGFKSRGNLTWHITPDIMAYYTFSQGFRPGGFNRSSGAVAPGAGGVNSIQQAQRLRPDFLNNHEIGMKGTFLDHRLQVNLSAYLMQWNNVQFLFFNPPYLGNTTFGVNGPDYHVKGVEAQFAAAADRRA